MLLIILNIKQIVIKITIIFDRNKIYINCSIDQITIIFQQNITINHIKFNFLFFINFKIVFIFNYNNQLRNVFRFKQKIISIDYFNFKSIKINNSKINLINFDCRNNLLLLN